MQSLEVSGAVRSIYGLLGVKRLTANRTSFAFNINPMRSRFWDPYRCPICPRVNFGNKNVVGDILFVNIPAARSMSCFCK